jgi:hypothetical protein
MPMPMPKFSSSEFEVQPQLARSTSDNHTEFSSSEFEVQPQLQGLP